MRVVFYKRDNKPVCTCDVCGRQDKWSNRWEAWEFGVGVGYRGCQSPLP